MINYKQTIYAAGDRTTKSSMVFTLGDVRAYILKLDFPGLSTEGCGLTVKAKRADDVVVVGYSKDPERYILQNNMYAVAGELRLEIALTAADGRYITTAEILAEVREGFGEPDVSGDDRVPVLTELIINATAAAEACNAAAGRAEAAAEAVNGHMTDPNAHAALFANKVDKEAGKGLSSNDYTNADKEKLAGLNAGLYEKLERKNQPGGYAGLGSDGKLTSTLMGGNVIKEITANDMDNIPQNLFPGVYLVSHPSGEWRGVLLVSYSMQLVSNEFSNTYYQMFILECGKIYTRNILAGTAEEWKSFVPIPVDSLASTETTAPLSAYQGKVLNETKVDKVSGKGLSSNDYSDADKSKLAGKAEREKIYGITVDIPAFTNQPEVSGSLDASFLGWNQTYYFVTLKNTDGTALAEGQFKLCNEIDGYASAVNQIFLLPGLDTGNSGILSENTLVDFKSVGGSWEMRLGDLAEIELPFTPSKNKKYIIEAELFRTLQRPGTTAANYNCKFSLKQTGLAGNYNCFIGHQNFSSIANQTFMQYNATPAEAALAGKKLIKTMLKTEILYGYDYLRGYGTVTNYALGDVDSACTTAPVNAEISTKDRSELLGSVTRFTISTYFYGNAGKKFANGSRVIIREVENNANGI